MLFFVGVKSSGVIECCFFVGVKSSGFGGHHLVASSGFVGPRHLQLLDSWLDWWKHDMSRHLSSQLGALLVLCLDSGGTIIGQLCFVCVKSYGVVGCCVFLLAFSLLELLVVAVLCWR